METNVPILLFFQTTPSCRGSGSSGVIGDGSASGGFIAAGLGRPRLVMLPGSS